MKVCILSHCFYPSKKRGGPTVSITNMVKNLADKMNLSVVTIIYDKDSDKPYDNVNVGKNRLFDSDVYYLQDNSVEAFYNCIAEIQPDVIYVSSLFSYQYSIAALKYGRQHKNVRVVVAPRGELMPLALKRKKLIKKPFLLLVKMLLTDNTEFHVTSEEEEIALRHYFKNNRVWKIKNLPSKIESDDNNLSKVVGNLNIAMIGRIHPIKNIEYAIKLLNEIKGNVVLNIYGPEEDKKYSELCKKTASELPDNIKVNFMGLIDHDTVGEELKKHHIFLSPTESENYGHSIIESLLCGIPVVISCNTPWRNLKSSNAGYDIDLSDRSSFVKAIQAFVEMNDETYQIWSSGAKAYINSGLAVEETVNKYFEMLIKESII